MIHIRIQQRNGRKTLTSVQGLSEQYDLKLVFDYPIESINRTFFQKNYQSL